jgi:hypothetical protein
VARSFFGFEILDSGIEEGMARIGLSDPKSKIPKI